MSAIDNTEGDLPLVTLGLPTFNGQRTIRRALDSIVAQSYPNIEVIICDDDSTDRTAQICAAYASKHENVSFEVNEQNLGDFGVGNIAKIAGMARGEYFVWMCQDDVWDVDFVSKLTAAVTSAPGIVAAMPACELFWINGKERLSDTYRISKVYWPQNASLTDNFFRIMRRTHEAETGRKIVLSYVIHGLVKTQLFRQSLELVNAPVELERHMVALWSLAGKLVYVDEELYLKEAPDMLLAMSENVSAEASHHAEMRESKHGEIAKRRSPFIRSTVRFLKAVWKLNGVTLWNRLVGSFLFLRYALDRAPGRIIKAVKPSS